MSSHGQRKNHWGKAPAFYILNLKQNEGLDISADLRLFFAASGDLRNVVKTVTEFRLAWLSENVSLWPRHI
ncbi:hypothetical protein ONS95_005779 [Cadophora gregata]|uniref:uncharacterized protein n=1 Tax=Cadophora gregata TaxID=51156 RepID=UPI0026DB39E4|nr:uncharacterized protein ONS95_005779 [Cadophora gregata]KAK0103777.1 hypothetical protein ONS95_005779 [Cadophora gregata]